MTIKPRNKVELIGRLVAAPSLDSDDGLKRVTMLLSTEQHSAKNTDEFKAEPHCVVAYGKLAERIIARCTTGTKVLIDGRLKTTRSTNTSQLVSAVIAEDFNVLEPASQAGLVHLTAAEVASTSEVQP